MTMNCPAKPTQRTVEPEAPTRALNTHVAYEDRDVINNPSIYAEMVQKSGQSLSPCVEVNGHMLADVSGDEVEAYLLKAGVVQPTAASADQPGLRRASP